MKRILALLVLTLFVSGCSDLVSSDRLTELKNENAELVQRIKVYEQTSSKLGELNNYKGKDEMCQILVDREIKDDIDYEFYETKSFWSNRLQTCIMTEKSLLESDYGIKDVKGNFMKGRAIWLFACSNDSHWKADIESIKKFEGYMDNVPYLEWQNTLRSFKDRSDWELQKKECEDSYNSYIDSIK